MLNMTKDCRCFLGPGIVCWGLLRLVAFLQLQKTVIIFHFTKEFYNAKKKKKKKRLESGLE